MRSYLLIILIVLFSCSNEDSVNNDQKENKENTPDSFAILIIKAFNENDFNSFYGHFITEGDYEYMMTKKKFKSKGDEKMQQSKKTHIISSNLKNSKSYFDKCRFSELKLTGTNYRLKKDKGGLLFINNFEISAIDQGEPVKIIFSKIVRIENKWKSAGTFVVE